MDLVGVEGVQVSREIKFCRRLGKVGDGGPRPLQVGLRRKEIKDAIMSKTKRLSEQEEPWKKINIVQDLTKMQREDEARARKEAEEKNSKMNDEEAKNWLFKVAGPRGQRRVVRVRKEENQPKTMSASQRGRRRGQH